MKIFFAGNTGTPGRERTVLKRGATRRLVSYEKRDVVEAVVLPAFKELRDKRKR